VVACPDAARAGQKPAVVPFARIKRIKNAASAAVWPNAGAVLARVARYRRYGQLGASSTHGLC